MSGEAERPEWLVPGAEVVVVHGHYGENVNTTTINTIAKRSFTVSGSDRRFSIDRQEHRPRDVWSSTWHVYPVESDEGQEFLAAKHQRRIEREARNACDRWMRNRTRENRLAAIAALQAIDEE